MGFKSFFRKGLAVTEEAAPAFGPLGILASVTAKAIFKAEEKFGAGKGKEKQEEVKEEQAVVAPTSVEMVEDSGHKLQDPVKLAKGLEQLNDGMVAILNAFGMLGGRKDDKSK